MIADNTAENYRNLSTVRFNCRTRVICEYNIRGFIEFSYIKDGFFMQIERLIHFALWRIIIGFAKSRIVYFGNGKTLIIYDGRRD